MHQARTTRDRRWCSVLVAIAASMYAPCFARAQNDPAATSVVASVLRLRIVQQDDAAVADADVRIRDARAERSARSDSAGNVRFDIVAAGLVEVAVRRVGFALASAHVRVETGENAFTIMLDDTIDRLDAMRIVSNRPLSGRIEDFERRLLRNEANAVVTAAQIDKRNPIALSQMLRSIAGIRLADSMGSIVAVSTRGNKMSLGRPVQCVLRMSVDGVVLPALSNIDAVIPKDVYGVEVFFGPSRIPPQFGGLRTDAWCGLIAIWTRSG